MASPAAGGNSSYDYFKAGAEVEVSNKDEGFRGSWYLGTVVREPRGPLRGSSKALVEYKTLVDHDDTARPLTEELELILLRPPPHQEGPGVVKFKLSDEVDAYYNDGWWEGVVTNVDEEGDQYSVFFRSSREQFVFKASQLRVHREWVGVDWVPPLTMEAEIRDEKLSQTSEGEGSKATAESDFIPGALVEVKGEEEGFEGSWYSATVVEKTVEGKYVVVYETLRNDDDTDFSREEFDGLNLRPRPPDVVSTERFKLGQKVNALYNDGWWEGEIMKVCDDDKYVVYFVYTAEEMEFSHSDLRVHQDWIDGGWAVSSSEAGK